MKPWELLGETRTPDGTLLALTRRDREYVILANGKSLMSSRMHGSEEALARCAQEAAGRPELHLTPPAAELDELRELYAAAY